MRTHALRLLPGDDLRLGIERERRARGIGAGCVVSCVGSLGRARLRLAGAEQVLERAGPFEIVSLAGTLSHDGPHLHVALADGEGRVVGGHLLEGCVVHTTAELVLGELQDVGFRRVLDPATGHRELVVRPRD
jgi:uncharacterized protein